LSIIQAFENFQDTIGRVLNAQSDMAAADKVEMFVALMNFTGSVLPNIVENVNQVSIQEVSLHQVPGM
jgi:hypothetical protein